MAQRQTLSDSLFEEDAVCYKKSNFFVVKNSEDEIIGSIKTTRWDNEIVLPIKRLYNIDVRAALNVQDDISIWHVGRLAIKKLGCHSGITLLKKLLVHAIYPVCMDNRSILVAECDSKLFRTLAMMGIKVKALGPSISYLNSETIPMYVEKSGLIQFLEANIHLHEPQGKHKRNRSISYLQANTN